MTKTTKRENVLKNNDQYSGILGQIFNLTERDRIPQNSGKGSRTAIEITGHPAFTLHNLTLSMVGNYCEQLKPSVGVTTESGECNSMQNLLKEVWQ